MGGAEVEPDDDDDDDDDDAINEARFSGVCVRYGQPCDWPAEGVASVSSFWHEYGV